MYAMPMSGPAVEAMLYLLDEAWEGDDEHSLMANLRSVTPDVWAECPAGGNRSIRAIFRHAGWAKYMYQDHGFGPATLRWDDERLYARDAEAAADPIAAHVTWAGLGHALLRNSIAALDDGDLRRERKAHWGEMMETRKLIAVLIEHDLYHAGEINHIRAILQRTDWWPGQDP